MRFIFKCNFCAFKFPYICFSSQSRFEKKNRLHFLWIKHLAFADRDLDAVMFQREQQQAAVELQRFNNTSPGCGEDITPPPSSLGSTPSPCWNNAMHHPIRFHVLPFHQHHSLIQQTHSLCPLPLVIKTETNPVDSDDSDVEVDVTSTPSSPPSPNLPSSSVPVSTINKNKISFSVESIIGRP